MVNSQNRSDDRVLPLAPKWHPVNKVAQMATEASGGALDVDTFRLIAGVSAAVAIIIALNYGPVTAPKPKEAGGRAHVAAPSAVLPEAAQRATEAQ